MVRLLRAGSMFSYRYRFGFNPTMVRLLRFVALQKRRDLAEFQSHNGAIAAPTQTSGLRLEACVSIPQWCDCCKCAMIDANETYEFQSHNGAIAALSEMLES